MSENIIDVNEYLNTYGALKSAIEGVNESQLKYKPTPNSWSITEVLSHLADHNLVVSFRIRKILAENNPQLAGFEQDSWVSETIANERSVKDILDVFRSLLVYNSLLFERLPMDSWNKWGLNEKGDRVSVADAIRGFIRHVYHHIEQINRIKVAFKVE